jgi:hypothetical protein
VCEKPISFQYPKKIKFPEIPHGDTSLQTIISRGGINKNYFFEKFFFKEDSFTIRTKTIHT